MTDFWSNWIIILTAITIIGTTWLLFDNRKIKTKGSKATTGHSYDGIEEYDNPLPAWWFYLFLGTIIYSIGYLIAYPGMGNFKGVLNWTQTGQWEAQIEKANAKYGAIFHKYGEMPIEELATDHKGLKMGQRIFANNCAQCHGSDARGSYGFADLTDKDWLFGLTPAAIKESISNGRSAAMPAWGQILGETGIDNVTAYVFSMSGREVDTVKAEAGKAQYQALCFACHGVDGTGNQALGAPNLTDDTWLYGSSETLVKHTIRDGRNGHMPAHKELLSTDKIHILTAYVYSLSQEN